MTKRKPVVQFTDPYTRIVSLTALQKQILKAKAQYRWLVAILGRRSGKTTVAIERLIDACWSNPRPNEWPLAYIAPTYKQAKRIAWGRFKQHFAPGEAKFKESELIIHHIPTGSKIYLLGCDTNGDTIRGMGLWDAVIDEIKDIPKQFTTEVLRPCFSDTGGGCLFIGTPGVGKGLDYELFKRCESSEWSDWKGWNCSSAEAGLIPPEEIEAAKLELDPEVFQREYGAAFSFRQGLVVKHFSSENIQPIEFNGLNRVHISCDFNVDPCMWVLAHRSPPAYHFFDEIVKENINVIEMIDEFAKRYPPDSIKAGITINGDASGHNRSINTEKKNQTSYTIMRNRLAELGYSDVRVVVPTKNPPVMDRVESFNAKIMNANGQVFIFVAPRCKHLISNLENLRWIEGTSDIWEPTTREIQKDRSLKFVKHIYDAASYLVYQYDPIRPVTYAEDDGFIQHNMEFGI